MSDPGLSAIVRAIPSLAGLPQRDFEILLATCELARFEPGQELMHKVAIRVEPGPPIQEP
ncbi:MAG: hypothetical protein HY816_04360 [Candidatus Wallbacteria bacterium]|nr:hypothetical protein [Candidatus Wallbacteria bacterium]